ncbi:MAG: DUF2905 domain-containing protein [Spongiibacteraceae bacterium]|jgi:hypothetical protein|nr:DUF2905 domain-containing protein [Spongiibacteraceae bacterium]
MGKLLMLIGALLLAAGLLIHFFPYALSWLGRLPGDIRIEGKRGSFFFPVTTMIVISVVLSLLLNWFHR